MKQKGLFDEDERLRRLTELGDPLQKLEGRIDWELFRPMLRRAFKKQRRKEGGRPPFDYLLMFKILMLQGWYNIADDQTEFQINDRLSFQRFIGLRLNEKVPDASECNSATIWLFREHLKAKGTADKLFTLYEKQLEETGLITRKGSILDATFVDAPRQRNHKEENAAIKECKMPEGWAVDEERLENGSEAEKAVERRKKHRLSQKDRDGRWAVKNKETHYGYKDHVKVDRDSKLIVKHIVTAASVHDSQKFVNLIDSNDNHAWGDSAYFGKELREQVLRKNKNLKLHICEKGTRGHPLTKTQKERNHKKSKVRARVEHVFGHMTNSMGGLFVRGIGIARASCVMSLKDLAYNLWRASYLLGPPKMTAA